MKENLRFILFRKPTLFPWLIVFLSGVMIYYLAFGLWAMTQASEGVMALLMVPYMLPVMVILAGADFALRKMLSQRFGIIWTIEIILLLAWMAWFSYRNFYQTIFITANVTPFIVLVTEPAVGQDLNAGRNLAKLQLSLPVPDDNILIIKNGFRSNEYKNLKAHTKDGIAYRQIYTMSYMSKDTIECSGKPYSLQYFILESEKYPHFRFSEEQFDSMRAEICKKL